MTPSPPSSCWQARWCSCLDYGAPSSELFLPSWTIRIPEKVMCWCPSHPRTPESEHLASGQLSPPRRPFAIRLVPAPPQSFFSAKAHPLHKPPEGDFAKALAGEPLQKASPLSNGGCGSVAYVLLEELRGGVVCYGGSAASLPGRKGLSPRSESAIALDRGETDGEQARGLGLGGAALLERLDYLLA